MTTTELCSSLGVTYQTLNTWYRWKRNTSERSPELPHPTKIGNRYEWTTEDLTVLNQFKKWIPKGRHGVMGNINSKHWGKKK